MDHAVLKVLSSGQSRNEKIRTLYTRTSARPKYGDSQENRGHAHQNLGPPKKILVMPIQISGRTPIKFDGHDVMPQKSGTQIGTQPMQNLQL